MSNEPKGTVLLVDDDDDSRELYSQILARDGYTVITADRGDLGLELATAHQPTVIVLDIGLPALSGVEVMRRLRGTPAHGTPVIAVTGRVMPSQQHEIRGEGFHRVLYKPASPREVLAAVADAMRRAPPPPPP